MFLQGLFLFSCVCFCAKRSVEQMGPDEHPPILRRLENFQALNEEQISVRLPVRRKLVFPNETSDQVNIEFPSLAEIRRPIFPLKILALLEACKYDLSSLPIIQLQETGLGIHVGMDYLAKFFKTYAYDAESDEFEVVINVETLYATLTTVKAHEYANEKEILEKVFESTVGLHPSECADLQVINMSRMMRTYYFTEALKSDKPDGYLKAFSVANPETKLSIDFMNLFHVQLIRFSDEAIKKYLLKNLELDDFSVSAFRTYLSKPFPPVIVDYFTEMGQYWNPELLRAAMKLQYPADLVKRMINTMEYDELDYQTLVCSMSHLYPEEVVSLILRKMSGGLDAEIQEQAMNAGYSKEIQFQIAELIQED